MRMMNEPDSTRFARRNEKYHFRKKRLIGSVVLTMLIVAMVTGFYHQGRSPAHKSTLVSKKGKENHLKEQEKEMIQKKNDINGDSEVPFFKFDGDDKTTPSGQINLPQGVASDIFHGNIVNPAANTYPYYVAIYDSREMDGITHSARPICGGLLYRQDLVLTAAHCLANDAVNGYQNARDLVVCAGFSGTLYANDTRNNMMNGGHWQMKWAVALEKHNNYNWNALGNDIGMIKIEDGGFTLGPRVALAPLARPSTTPYPAAGTQVTLLGAGLYANNMGSDFLRRGQATVTSFATCSADGPANRGRDFCFRHPHYGICGGDSGSPIIDHTTNQVIGIATMGNTHCDSAILSGGIFIPAYADWIRFTRERMGRNRCTGGTRLWLRND